MFLRDRAGAGVGVPFTVPATAKPRVLRGAPHTPFITTTLSVRVRVHDSLRPLWVTPKDVQSVGVCVCVCVCVCMCV